MSWIARDHPEPPELADVYRRDVADRAAIKEAPGTAIAKEAQQELDQLATGG